MFSNYVNFELKYEFEKYETYGLSIIEATENCGVYYQTLCNLCSLLILTKSLWLVH